MRPEKDNNLLIVERVSELAIKENGYVPNQSALSLVRTRSDMIGIVVADKMGSKYVMEDPYFSRLFTFLEREIRLRGKYMLLILGQSGDEILTQAARTSGCIVTR